MPQPHSAPAKSDLATSARATSARATSTPATSGLVESSAHVSTPSPSMASTGSSGVPAATIQRSEMQPPRPKILGRLAESSPGSGSVPKTGSLDGLRQRAAAFCESDLFRSRRSVFERLAETGSQPRVLVVACSDCACDPGYFLGAEPGTLFTVRNAGNVVPAYGAERGESAAALELALTRMPIEHIVVCGHSGCLTLDSMLQTLLESDDRPDWTEHFQQTADAMQRAGLTDEIDCRAWAAQHNVLVQLHHLSTHPDVSSRLADGNLQLHGWYFDTAAGELFTARSLAFAGDVCNQFEPV